MTIYQQNTPEAEKGRHNRSLKILFINKLPKHFKQDAAKDNTAKYKQPADA
ncbi:hypothetical protein [Sodalis sp. C49]|uniref:hypothetical protein n=1 Tax=unclassified Sodalis (in: enterobacteria) TaxID=2636512 RepID=UPI003965B4D1